MKNTILFLALTLFINFTYAQNETTEKKEYYNSGALKSVGQYTVNAATSFTSECEEKVKEASAYFKNTIEGITDQGYLYLQTDYKNTIYENTYYYSGYEVESKLVAVSDYGDYPTLIEYQKNSEGKTNRADILQFNSYRDLIFVASPPVIEACKGQFELIDDLEGLISNKKLFDNNRETFLELDEVNFKSISVSPLEGHTVKNGRWSYYYENGQLEKTGIYSEGRKIGKWKNYYENAQLESDGYYIDGQASGEWKVYHENGKLKQIGTFIDGQASGEWKFYYENEKLKQIGTYIDGNLSGDFKSYHENGKLNEIGTYIDGKASGEVKFYYDNAQLEEIGSFIDGEVSGEWKFYHENGKLKQIGTYIDGEESGEWKYYHENGQLEQIGIYIDGKASGEWKIYHSNAKIYQVRLWKEDKFMDILSCFDSEGNSLSKGSLVNGNGTVKYYDEKGNITSIKTYENGIVQEE